MDNSLLLQISDSLNLINKSLTSVGGVKPFVPVIAALGGVVVGVLLNTAKDYFVNRSKNTKYMNCLNKEIEVLLNESSVSFISLLEVYDIFMTTNPLKFHKNYTPMSYVCFDKFFPDVVGGLDENDFRLITNIYSHAKTVDIYAERFLNHTHTPNENDSSRKLCDILMSLVVQLYLLCKEYINEKPLEYKDPILFIAEELKASGPYLEAYKVRVNRVS